MSKSKHIISKLSQTLPDDRPITAIQIVEHTEKCPEGFTAISRTYDQDQDADLWREHSLFMRKQGRYLCLSKTEGLPNYVVQEVSILSDKDMPPEGYSLLQRTADTEQKAWRKRQLVYRLTHIKNASQAVTDIIVCNRLKQAPSGFSLAGEINGMTLCYKIGALNSIDFNNTSITNGKSIKNGNNSPFLSSRAPPERPPRSSANIRSPTSLQNTDLPLLDDGNDHDYERLNPSYLQPTRPAPRPPGSSSLPPVAVNGFSTLAVYNGMEGVPFVLNSKLVGNVSLIEKIPVLKKRSRAQIQNEYAYNFSVERQT